MAFNESNMEIYRKDDPEAPKGHYSLYADEYDDEYLAEITGDTGYVEDVPLELPEVPETEF